MIDENVLPFFILMRRAWKKTLNLAQVSGGSKEKFRANNPLYKGPVLL